MFGNYSNYYGYRNDKAIDSRLLRLSAHLFQDKDVLDIGCNSGILTLDIAFFHKPKSIKAIDIDPSLIRKAKQNLFQKSSLYSQDEINYFPGSCIREHSTLPFHQSLCGIPTAITFRCSDFIHEPSLSTLKYDVIMAMSITKWIHLENGDAGIKLFFEKCFSSLRVGGMLVLEPQAWDTYKKKIKVDKKLEQSYAGLKLRPEEFQILLKEVGFKLLETLGQAESSFKRPIFVYQKVIN